MLTVDIILVALTVAIAVWGYHQGVSVGVLVLAGFGVGALVGSRVAPLILDGGLRDPFAPVVALPAALLLGAVLAAGLERFGLRLRRRLRRRRVLDALGGVLLAGCAGLVLVWILAAVLARVDSLKETVSDSALIGMVNSVLPPPGPLLSVAEPLHSAPAIEARRARRGPADPRIRQDPDVEAAASSVVRVINVACGRRWASTGWIAGEGMVVTNAHALESAKDPGIKIEGVGETHDAETIFYDHESDVAILRAPAVKGRPALALGGAPEAGKDVAVLGFPFGGRYKVREARVGPTYSRDQGSFTRRTTSLRAGIGVSPGSSGSPVVDGGGRVVAMVWASRGPRPDQGDDVAVPTLAVPSPTIRKALRSVSSSPRAVETGDCH